MSRTAKTIWGGLVAFGMMAAVVAILGDDTTREREAGDAEPAPEPRTERTSPADPWGAEVEDGRSYGEVLATEMTGSASPSSRLSRRFNRRIDRIATSCGHTRQWVADRIITGHQTLIERGGSATLMDVAAGWREAVRGSPPTDCSSVLAGLLVTLEESG